MKKVLVLVLSADFAPFDKMIQTSLETWDSVNVQGVESVFYCGKSDKPNTDKIVYFPINESYHTMGHKTIEALKWALSNKEFDYIARVNSSCYVSKKKLLDHCQTLADKNVFAGLIADDVKPWIWGGGQFIISRDVVTKIVANSNRWDHREIEDKAMSFLVSSMGIKLKTGLAASIDHKGGDDWLFLAYNAGVSLEFSDWEKLKANPHFFVRVKQDGKRELDEHIMRILHEINF